VQNYCLYSIDCLNITKPPPHPRTNRELYSVVHVSFARAAAAVTGPRWCGAAACLR